MKLKKSDKVSWAWANGTAEGLIVSQTKARVTKKINGKSITRNGSAADPAVEIKQKNGSRVLKLSHEVKKG